MIKICISCIVLVFGIPKKLYTQTYFERIISIGDDTFEEGTAIVEHNNNLYVAGNGFTAGPNVAYFCKFDSSGNTIWVNEIENIQNKGHNLINIGLNKFLLTAKNWGIDAQTSYFLDTLGNVSRIDTCLSDKVDATTIATNTTFDKYYVTSSNAFQNNGEELNSILCWHNYFTGELDSMIIEDNGFNDHIGDLSIGPDSLLTVVYRYQDSEIKSDYYRSIHKFNKEKEKVWEWRSEKLNNRTSGHGFTLAILEDGRMVHTNGRFAFQDLESPSIRAINPDGSLSWYYDFPIWLFPMPPEDFFKYDLFHLIRTENNDIVGCGWYDDVPNLKGYLFRMSSEGKMLWERYYYTDSINYYNQFGDEFISGGQFFDVEELANGDLAVVGEKHIHKQEDDGSWTREEDLWLVRLNADGCIDDYCGEDRKTTITSSKEEELEEEIFTFYPNPSSDEITIESNEKMTVEIVSSIGVLQRKLILEKGKHTLDISGLQVGVYLFRYYVTSKVNVAIKRFLKI